MFSGRMKQKTTALRLFAYTMMRAAAVSEKASRVAPLALWCSNERQFDDRQIDCFIDWFYDAILGGP